PLLIGSVKSNIGHLNAAAGVPALIKAALAVKEGVIPASLKFDTPNPAIDFARGPVEVVRATTPWPSTDGRPRRAGVSGFGVGGSNMHLIVEQYVAPTDRARAPAPTTAATLSLPIVAASGGDLAACIAALRSGDRSDAGAVRVAVVAGDAA